MHLFEASKQWATRPPDERFWTLQEMYETTKHYADQAAEATVNMGHLRVLADGEGELKIMGDEGKEAKLTHWSFGQLCQRAQAPAGYLRTLPATLTANCLNNGLITRGSEEVEAKVLFHANGSLVCRAFTSDQYARIWNHDVASRLLMLQESGWRVPPGRPAMSGQPGARQATAADVLQRSGHPSLGIKVGDWIAPAGIYASDHDMFAFLVNEEVRIEDGTEGGLARGVFVSNSEVGAAAFRLTRFLYRHVCGNHIVWDAKDVQELKIIHTGRNDVRYGGKLRAELLKYANESTSLEQGRIEQAKRFVLGQNKDQVLDELFKLRVLPKKTLEDAYNHAVCDADLHGTNPRSVYGMVQGVTSLSQRETFADERVTLDRAAGKILSIAF